MSSALCELAMTAVFSPPLTPYSSSQSQSSYIIRNPQQRRISQSQPVRGREEEQDDIVSADVEEVEVVEGVAGEEDHHDEQEEHGEENAEAEGHHDEHDEDGMQGFGSAVV